MLIILLKSIIKLLYKIAQSKNGIFMNIDWNMS